MNNFSDLEFLSLADKIARDYKTFLAHIFDESLEASSINDLTASRILMACDEAEEPMLTSDLQHFLRLDETDFYSSLKTLIRLDYVYTERALDARSGKYVRLTPSGIKKAATYKETFTTFVHNADTLSSLILTDIEHDNIVSSLILLQNRTNVLLRKASSQRKYLSL